MAWCPPWPIDTTCLPDDWDPNALTPEQRAALEIASELLKAATGYWYGPCLVTVRPCAPERGYPCTGPCGCARVCRVKLPAPVTPGNGWGVVGVTQNGQQLPPSAWRVDNLEWLVRQDGQCFPACQRMDLPLGQPGTWGVTYWRGMPVPLAGQRAVTALAVRVYEECSDGGCWVDPRVTQLTRAGVTYNMDPETDGTALWLSLPVVQAWIAQVNPAKLTGPAVFWTPEMGQVFTTTSTGEPIELTVLPVQAAPGQVVTATVTGETATLVIDWGDGTREVANGAT